MSRSLPLRWLRHLGALTTALLMLPASSIFAPVQASPSVVYTNKTCRGVEFLQPNDPQVRLLQSLIYRYKILLPEGYRLGDRAIPRYEFEIVSNTVLVQIRNSKTAPSRSDFLTLQRLYQTNSSSQSLSHPALAYLQTRLLLSEQPVTAEEIKLLQTLNQQYPIPDLVKDQMNRYEFAIALNTTLEQIRQKIFAETVQLSEQSSVQIEQLLKTSGTDLINLGLNSTSPSLSAPVPSADMEDLRPLAQKSGLILLPVYFTWSVDLQTLAREYELIGLSAYFSPSIRLPRYEFAIALDAVLDGVNELIARGYHSVVTQADLATLQRLQEKYSLELATVRGRVDALAARTTELESQQFSTLAFIHLRTAPSSIGNTTELESQQFSTLAFIHLQTAPSLSIGNTTLNGCI